MEKYDFYEEGFFFNGEGNKDFEGNSDGRKGGDIGKEAQYFW